MKPSVFFKVAILVYSIFLLPSYGCSQQIEIEKDWIKSDSLGGHPTYINRKYLSIDSINKKVEEYIVFTVDTFSFEGKNYDSIIYKVLVEFDCSKRKIKFEYNSIFSKDNKLIFEDSHIFKNRPWNEIEPGSGTDFFLIKTCEMYFRKP